MHATGRKPDIAPLAGSSTRRRPSFLPAATAVLALLFLLLAPQALAQGTPAPVERGPDLQIVIIADGTGQDHIAVSYGGEPSNEQVRTDFAELAKELGVPPPKVTVTREGGITAGEARLPGLINPTSGPVRLDPLIHAFREYGFFRVTALIMGQFAPPASGNVSRPGLRVETRVGQNAVDHLVWVDQSNGPPDRVASVSGGGPEWRTMALLVFIAVVAAGTVFLIVYVVLGQRRAAAAREGES